MTKNFLANILVPSSFAPRNKQANKNTGWREELRGKEEEKRQENEIQKDPRGCPLNCLANQPYMCKI